MQTSRQVLKKRHGISVPVSSTKRKRMQTLLFLDSELRKLDKILDENDINLEDIITKEDQDKLNENYYLRFIKNQYSLNGRPMPFNITITIKIGEKDVATIIEEVLNCFRLPLTIGIDFWAVLTSFARPNGDILYPSRATSCNKIQTIKNSNDIDTLIDEFKLLPVERIIQKHFVNESNSGMTMQNMLALELYITKYPFQ